MDELEKLRKEIERLKGEIHCGGYKSAQEHSCDACIVDIYQNILSLIDSMQKEPVSKVWHDTSEEPKEGFTIVVYMKDDSLKVLTSWGENGDFCIGEGFWYNIHQQRKWAYVDDLVNLSNVERTEKDRKEPVSEELEEAAEEYSKFERGDDTEADYDINRYEGFIAGAEWQKEQMMKDAVEAEIEITSKGVLLQNLKAEDFDYADKVRVIIIKED